MINTLFKNDTYTETKQKELRAAIYCRLSKDDEGDGESSSIQTQRAMLEHYCAQQGWEVAAVYQDDGFTGLNMNRPDLMKMLKAIECKQIDIVLTKDGQKLHPDRAAH